MFRDKKVTIAIVAVLMISVIGLGIAFAAFSQTLTIGGSGTVDASSWSVVFEGADGSNTIGAPTLVGTATEVTRPTIKNNSTEISNYEVSLATPGDSITYNFKVHNKGDYAAEISSIIVSGREHPVNADGVNGSYLVTDSTVYNTYKNTLNKVYYKFYYTNGNKIVGQDPGKDCLEPGESEYLSLKIVFGAKSDTNINILPKNDVHLDNLGVSVIYNQHANNFCYYESDTPRETVTNEPFINYDGVYYTYEGKSFIGTGVNNVIISENVIGQAKYSSEYPTKCSDGSDPVSYRCPEGVSPAYIDTPVLDMAEEYCTGCRLMTLSEYRSWVGCIDCSSTKPNMANYNSWWWLADSNYDLKYPTDMVWTVFSGQSFYGTPYSREDKLNTYIRSSFGVRPVVSIPSTATISGSGTQLDPYVITTN